MRPDADPMEHLLHALRNSVGAACAAIAVAKRAQERHEYARAAQFIDYAEQACGKCRQLLTDARPEAPGG